MRNMNHEEDLSDKPVHVANGPLSKRGSAKKPIPAGRRSKSFIWVTWLTKLMAGEKQCEWATWFRSHYIWEKVPSGLDVAKWTADHAQLLRTRKAALEAEGFTVYAEDQNSFTLVGETGIEVSGKPDIVAIRGSEICVEDCKTGSPRHSDHFQVLIYMLALPHVEGPWKDRKLEGRLVYGNTLVDIPSSKIDDQLKELFRKTILRIGGEEPPTKMPSWGECRYCDISSADCPERMETEPKAIGNHGLF
jgi:hypothetical protein